MIKELDVGKRKEDSRKTFKFWLQMGKTEETVGMTVSPTSLEHMRPEEESDTHI